MQHTEHDNNPMARPLATLPECFLFVKCPTYHTYQRTKCPTYHIYQRTVRTPTVRCITRTCVQSTEVSQHHKEYSGTAYNQQQFCYSNYPIKCSTAVQLIHTGRYHEQTRVPQHGLNPTWTERRDTSASLSALGRVCLIRIHAAYLLRSTSLPLLGMWESMVGDLAPRQWLQTRGLRERRAFQVSYAHVLFGRVWGFRERSVGLLARKGHLSAAYPAIAC